MIATMTWVPMLADFIASDAFWPVVLLVGFLATNAMAGDDPECAVGQW